MKVLVEIDENDRYIKVIDNDLNEILYDIDELDKVKED